MGKLTANLINVRVAGSPIYTPAHISAAGKTIRQRATFSVYANGRDEANPEKFKVTAWGKMADSVAKSCGKGKKLTLVCSINTYKGRIPMPNANPMAPAQFITDGNGQPLLIEKTGFTVEEIDYGADAAALIISEIQAGLRPQCFAVPGHPDEAQWKAICKQRNDLEFVIGSQFFGYAQVQNPVGGQVIDHKTIGQNHTPNQVNTGTAFVQHQGNPAMVANGFAMPGMPAPTGQPVVVNGTNMGYAVPNGSFVPPAMPVAPPAMTGFHM